jgi:hypothetical protein
VQCASVRKMTTQWKRMEGPVQKDPLLKDPRPLRHSAKTIFFRRTIQICKVCNNLKG